MSEKSPDERPPGSDQGNNDEPKQMPAMQAYLVSLFALRRVCDCTMLYYDTNLPANSASFHTARRQFISFRQSPSLPRAALELPSH